MIHKKYLRNILFILFWIFLIYLNYNCTTSDIRKDIDQGWENADKILSTIIIPKFADNIFIITDFGAKGDGITDCSEAIRKTIQECNEAGGGKILIPKGTYLTGPIHLLSNINLHFEDSAKIVFTTDKNSYLPNVFTRFEGMECMNYSPFIYAYEKENIAITGKGIIDGQGQTWWSWKGHWSGSIDSGWKTGDTCQRNDVRNLTKMVADGVPVDQRIFGEGHYLRPNFIQFYKCKNILIEEIQLINSPMWNIHPVLSENITVKNITIKTYGPNNDGLNPESSKNILIDNCLFDTGDDCIAIKSGRNEDGRRLNVSSENIIIRNCTMFEGHGGIVIGSEISGNVRNIYAENCVMNSPNLDRAIRIKSNSLRGGVVENVYVRNIKVDQVKEAVLKINLMYENDSGNNNPIVRNIFIEDLHSFKSKFPIWINATDKLIVENIYLLNCTFKGVEKDNYIENGTNVVMENVTIEKN